MSRNMIEANKKIFSVLKEFVKQSDVSSPCPVDAARYIKTDETEKKWLKELVIKKTYALPALCFATFTFEDTDYFAAIGWENSAEFEAILEPVDMNGGIFTALISEMKIAVKRDANPYEIFDEILYFYKESSENYAGHDFTGIIKFFEPVLLYRLNEDSPHNSENLFNLIGYFLCRNYNKLPLNFSSQTILEFEKAFVEGPLSLPYENLLHSLTSVQWKYSFLDGYRCLERLFPLLKLDELHQKLSISVSLTDFASEIEKIIDWKPKEDISLEKIINDSPTDSVELLRDVKQSLDGDREGKKLGYRFYQIRNSIVHFRPSTELFSIDDENWNKLIGATLKIIRHWYKFFGAKLI